MHDRLVLARQVLAQSTRELHDAMSPLTDVQWRWQASETSWSPLQILEHLAVLEEAGMRNFLAKFPMGAEAVERPIEALIKYDEKLTPMVLDRSRKIEAPDRVKPLGALDTPEKAMAAFVERRAKTIAFAEAPTWDIATRTHAHPIFGHIDGVQWLILTGAHTQRHLLQLAEAKSAAGWPA
jgi:hypothetical protein